MFKPGDIALYVNNTTIATQTAQQHQGSRFKIGDKVWCIPKKAKGEVISIYNTRYYLIRIRNYFVGGHQDLETWKCETELKPLNTSLGNLHAVNSKNDSKTLTGGIQKVKDTLTQQKKMVRQHSGQDLSDVIWGELTEEGDGAQFVSGPKCECGVESVHGNINSSFHSSWCPRSNIKETN